MQFRDSDIDQMLQGIEAPGASIDHVDSPPPAVIAPVAPVTPYGEPNIASVVPGQSDADLVLYLFTWKKAKNRKNDAAFLVYAGVLGSTAPKQVDYSDADAYRVAYSQWLNRCTDRQRRLLKMARERKAEKRRASERADYAQMVMDERGVAVREYVTGLSPKDSAERRRQSAEKAQRYRDRKKAELALK